MADCLLCGCLLFKVDDTETHFGGFLKKKKQSSESGETLEKRKSRKETIEEIVAKSKLYKASI